MAKKDLSGRKFGRLTVVGEAEPFVISRRLERAWICRCECGKVVRVRQSSLEQGNTKSCGCLRQSRQHVVTAFGKTQNITDWSRETGVQTMTILRRLRSGWEPERAVSEAPGKRGRKKDGD